MLDVCTECKWLSDDYFFRVFNENGIIFTSENTKIFHRFKIFIFLSIEHRSEWSMQLLIFTTVKSQTYYRRSGFPFSQITWAMYHPQERSIQVSNKGIREPKYTILTLWRVCKSCVHPFPSILYFGCIQETHYKTNQRKFLVSDLLRSSCQSPWQWCDDNWQCMYQQLLRYSSIAFGWLRIWWSFKRKVWASSYVFFSSSVCSDGCLCNCHAFIFGFAIIEALFTGNQFLEGY